jgi:hypothetical protein
MPGGLSERPSDNDLPFHGRYWFFPIISPFLPVRRSLGKGGYSNIPGPGYFCDKVRAIALARWRSMPGMPSIFSNLNNKQLCIAKYFEICHYGGVQQEEKDDR